MLDRPSPHVGNMAALDGSAERESISVAAPMAKQPSADVPVGTRAADCIRVTRFRSHQT